MKAIGLILLGLALAGCAPSRFANDPRAAVIGPAYLDCTADNPRDRDTELYNPVFGIDGVTNLDASIALISSASTEAIRPLLVVRPAMPASVEQIRGKGYPCLEHAGMPLLSGARH